MELPFKIKKENKVHYAKVESGFNIEPSKHWKILFYFGLCLLFIFLGFSWYVYAHFDENKITDLVVDEYKIKSLNVGEVEKTIEYFKNKKVNFDILQSIKPGVPDPRF